MILQQLGAAAFKKTRTCILAILTISVVAMANQLNAQNIVLDPSLEDTLKCPASIGRFYSPTNPSQRYIEHWRATNRASPDLHNTCGYNSYMPHSGDGYAGIILWDPAGTREYISASFSSPMIAGECYYVECYVALRDNCTRTIEEFQFSFSQSSPVDFSWPPPAPLNFNVDYQLSTPVSSNTWEKRSFFYQAVGGEMWVTIGNFVDNNSTTVSQVSNIGSVSAYYFIDDLTITKLDIGPDVVMCPNDTAIFTSNIDCPNLQYSWSTGDTGMSTTTTNAGVVSLTLFGPGGCSATDQATVTLPTGGGIDAGSDTTILAGDVALLGVIGTQNAIWSPPVNLSCINCPDPQASPTTTQTYVVTGLDVNGCDAIDSVTVFVNDPIDDPVDDDPVDDPIDDDPVDDDPVDDPIEDDVVDEPINSDSSATYEEVEEIYFYVPNAFTPDGDEHNNVFMVSGGPFEYFSLIIWDRWGQTVFETNEPMESWDGSNGRGTINHGVYTYQLKVKTASGKLEEWVGHVTVLK